MKKISVVTLFCYAETLILTIYPNCYQRICVASCFLTKSDIILKYELLDTPEFFWEYPELEAIYQVGANYLELKPRTQILSLKLTTIHELFEILADDLKHKHSSKHEWIIIWLIAVEILIFIVNDILLKR